MAITRVWIAPGCINCGLSETTCPEVFTTDEDTGDAKVVEEVDYSLYDVEIKQAAEECPVGVIHFEEDEASGAQTA